MTVFPMMKTVIKRILTMTALLMIWTWTMTTMVFLTLPKKATMTTLTMMEFLMTRIMMMITMVHRTMKTMTMTATAFLTAKIMMMTTMVFLTKRRTRMRITTVFRILKITMMTTTVFQTTWRMICPERAESILSVSATEQPGDASSFCLPQLFSSFATGNPRRSSTRSGNWRRRRKRKLEKHNFSEVDLTLH